MAGAGYKLFNTGDVLTAQQVNEYLMQQTTMVFASAAARTSALSGVLAEGMVSYLQDTNTLEVYDGSSWVGATGDITGLTAGTGITISSATGPVPTITNSVATTFDALGDLVVGTGADTFAKLTVGANGESIVADSSTSTGLRYNPQNALANPIINGGFDIWQRGTSFNSGSVIYTSDRWQQNPSGSSTYTITRQTTSDTTNLPNIQYCARIARNSGAGGTTVYYNTTAELVNSTPFIGKTVTYSFYARVGSANTHSFTAQLWYNTSSSEGNVNVGPGSWTNLFDTSFSPTTTWVRYVFTATIPANATQIAPGWKMTSVSSSVTTNDYLEVTGVQIDLGTYTASSAPTFRRSGGTLAGELAACQRYYQRVTPSQNTSPIALGYAYNTTVATITFPLKTTMRVAPTSVEQNAASVCSLWDQVNASIQTTAVALNTVGPDNVTINCTVASGLTAFRPYVVFAGTSGYLAVSAEL